MAALTDGQRARPDGSVLLHGSAALSGVAELAGRLQGEHEGEHQPLQLTGKTGTHVQYRGMQSLLKEGQAGTTDNRLCAGIGGTSLSDGANMPITRFCAGLAVGWLDRGARRPPAGRRSERVGECSRAWRHPARQCDDLPDDTGHGLFVGGHAVHPPECALRSAYPDRGQLPNVRRDRAPPFTLAPSAHESRGTSPRGSGPARAGHGHGR
jgi:hypothetical protein